MDLNETTGIVVDRAMASRGFRAAPSGLNYEYDETQGVALGWNSAGPLGLPNQ